MSVVDYISEVIHLGPKAILYEPVFGPRDAVKREIDVLQAHYEVGTLEYEDKICATINHYVHWRARWRR